MTRDFVFLWLAGASLRATILALPPVLPDASRDLGLTGSDVGVLTALPSLLFALAAVPGARLVFCLGAVRTVAAGLLINALGAAARGFANDVLSLGSATFLMCLGVAVMQTALPSLVRAWAPTRIGLAAAIYTNGLLIAEVLATAWSPRLPLLLVENDWHASLAFWALPVLFTGVFIAALGRRPREVLDRAPAQWWPNWRDARVWRFGTILGSVNAAYFALNGFLPGWTIANGSSALVHPTLLVLNLSQLPASLALLVYADRLVGKPVVYVIAGATILIGVVGLLTMPGPATMVWAAICGFALGGLLTLTLALPSRVGKVEETPRLSAAMSTISYTLAMLSALLGGCLWSMTGHASAAFAPAGALVLFATGLGCLLNLSELAEAEGSRPDGAQFHGASGDRMVEC